MNKTAYHVQCFNTFTTLNSDESKEYDAEFLNENVECTTSTSDEQIFVEQAAHSENLNNARVVIKREEITWSDEEAPLFPEVHEDTLMDASEFKIEETSLDIKEALDPLEVADNETLESKPLTSGVKDSPPTCIFCSQVEKRFRHRRSKLSKGSSKQKINMLKEQAESLGDAKLLEKIQDCDCIFYHGICDLSFTLAYRKRLRETKPQGKSSAIREIHALALEGLSAFVQTEVIEKEQIFYLTDLTVKYKAMLLEFNRNIPLEDIHYSTAAKVKHKLLKKFGAKIIIRRPEKGKQRIIVYKQGIDKNIISDFLSYQTADKTVQQSVAYEIRNAVRSTVPEELELPLKVEGECHVPDELFDFMYDLIQGPDVRRQNSGEDLVKIQSICQDIINAITKGRVKPSKHFELGLAKQKVIVNGPQRQSDKDMESMTFAV